MELLYFTCVFLAVKPFLWDQGQGHLSISRSNIKITLSKKGHYRGILVSKSLLSLSIEEFCYLICTGMHKFTQNWRANTMFSRVYLSVRPSQIRSVHISVPCPGGSVVSVSDSMTWWLWVSSPAQTNIFSSIFSALTSAEACEKSSRWLWKESCVSTGVRKPRNTCASLTVMIWP